MIEQRRVFLKTTLRATALGVGMLISAKSGKAATKSDTSSNGVVSGHSPKKEILYKKTTNWDIYYKAAY